MTESKFVEPSKNEVIIECPYFSDEEKEELENFLKSQPGIHVRHQNYVNRTYQPWHLVVVLGAKA